MAAARPLLDLDTGHEPAEAVPVVARERLAEPGAVRGILVHWEDGWIGVHDPAELLVDD